MGKLGDPPFWICVTRLGEGRGELAAVLCCMDVDACSRYCFVSASRREFQVVVSDNVLTLFLAGLRGPVSCGRGFRNPVLFWLLDLVEKKKRGKAFESSFEDLPIHIQNLVFNNNCRHYRLI